MDESLRKDIVARLKEEYGFKQRGDWLQQGKCPSCGKNDIYVNAAHPWVIRCNRRNHCGFEEHVKDLFPDLFSSWSERYPTTPQNPNAAADAYLRDMRGFDLPKIKGWYAQENFWSAALNLGSATVRFALPTGPQGEAVTWERIIDRPERFGRQKANFKGAYGGLFWAPPTLDFSQVEEIWLVEGIFDAIALYLSGIPAVAIMSSGNYPAKSLARVKEQRDKDNLPRLVWALDADKAGRQATLKHAERAHQDGWDIAAAQCPPVKGKNRDWNECLLLGALTDTHIKTYRHHGALLLAETPGDAGRLIFEFTKQHEFSFAHQNSLYWFSFDDADYAQRLALLEKEKNEDAEKQARGAATKISRDANCLPNALYFLKNEVTDESWYYFRIDFPHDGSSIKSTFTAAQLTSTAEFKTRLLGMGAGAYWLGAAKHLDQLVQKWTYNLKTVQTIDYIGYSAKHGTYVFDRIAAKDGKLIDLNEEDYFDVKRQLAIKSLNKSIHLDINKSGDGAPNWFELLTICYGVKGHLALAYWLGSLFAEQVRAEYESYPFLEIVGEPGAGKSTLISTLWKLLGRANYEGFDPMKASSVGNLRNMAQVSNLPVVLIEADREAIDGAGGRPRSSFNWDNFKSLYNGGSLRTTGVKNSGNDTYEPQFRGALVISQNNPVAASKPILERIIHLWFDKSHQSEKGREAGLELGRLAPGEISGFIAAALVKERQILDLFKRNMRNYELQIQNSGIYNLRLQKNYAQLMVLIDALALICPISARQMNEARELCISLAQVREQEVQVDPPILAQFWETFDYLDRLNNQTRLNHSGKPKEEIAVNLNHYIQLAGENRQPVPPLTDLKAALKTGKSRPFLRYAQVRSAIYADRNKQSPTGDPLPDTLKCWVFKASV